MDVQVIHHHVNRSRPGIAAHHRSQRLGKFWRGAVGGGQGETPTRFRFHDTEDIGGAAAFIFVVPFCHPAGGSGNRESAVECPRTT